MKAVFIESSEFTAWVREHLPDETYAALQRELMDEPEKGSPMPGCGGLRKVRTPDPRRGKGKRGGARVIYLHVPEVSQFFLLDVYGKDEKDDLIRIPESSFPALERSLSVRSHQLPKQMMGRPRRVGNLRVSELSGIRISPQEKRILARLADQLKREARSKPRRRKGGRSNP